MRFLKTRDNAVFSIIRTLKRQEDWITDRGRYWKSLLARVIVDNLLRDDVIAGNNCKDCKKIYTDACPIRVWGRNEKQQLCQYDVNPETDFCSQFEAIEE